MKGLVSIIIPIYNTEKYIRECLDSAINQTYNNIEIILINDGSTDNSQNICEEYTQKYKNIKLFNIRNHGVSYSRNFGIDKSDGEYIVFVDSDDYIENKMIEELINVKDEKDGELLIYNYSKVYGTTDKKTYEISNATLNKEEFLEKFFEYYNKLIVHSPCNKLYKSKIIKENNIKFNTSLTIGEDLIFNLEYFKHCDTFRIVNEYYYHYRFNQESVTNKFRKDYYNQQKYLLNSVKDFLIEGKAFNPKNEQEYRRHVCNSIINSIQNLFLEDSPYSKKQQEEIITNIVSSKEVSYLKDVDYELLKLKILKKFIIKKDIKSIMFFSILKERIKKIVGK